MALVLIFICYFILNTTYGTGIPPRPKPLTVFKDISELKVWYNDVIEQVHKNNTLSELKSEACHESKNNTKGISQKCKGVQTMCEAFKKARELYEERKERECIKPLTDAECYSITMYTHEFYSIYNCDLRNDVRKPYSVYTGLLFSGLKKLSKIQGYRAVNQKLYRGLGGSYGAPSENLFYFKQFTSTSLINDVAEYFSGGTMITFLPTRYGCGVNIAKFSKNEDEAEVLLSPFEAFEVAPNVEQSIGNLTFISSKQQNIMGKCRDITPTSEDPINDL